MNTEPRPSFRGSSAAEAEDFVQAVRRKAWAEQQQFDYRWMATFAAAQMSGQALRWHMSLPRDIQTDWGKLEVALLNRFAPNQPKVVPNNNPMVRIGASAEPTRCTGRIKVMDSATGLLLGYISKGILEKSPILFSGVKVTKQAGDALVVQFTPSSSPVTLDLVDKSAFHRLALRATDSLELPDTTITKLSLICFATGDKPGSIRYSDPLPRGWPVHVQHAVWKIGADGSITPIWPPYPQASVWPDWTLEGPVMPFTVPPLPIPEDVRWTPVLYFRSIPEDQSLSEVWRGRYKRARLEFEHA